MAIAKPVLQPRFGEAAGAFGVAGPNETEPNSGKKDIGWVPGEKPPAPYMTWLFRVIYDWIQYLGQGFFTADVGSNNPGASGTGDGAGPGLLGTGSAAGSRGGRFIGTGNNPGVRGDGSGTDAGGDFIGGPTGPGARFVPGGGATPVRGAMAAPAQVAPSAPVDGDGWYDGAGLFWRIAGATKQLLLTVAGVLTRSQLPAVGQQVSSSSGLFTTTSASYVDVTNLAITITVGGRPVVIVLQPDGTASDGFINSSVVAGGHIQLLRGASRIGGWLVSNAQGPYSLILTDVIAAGTYTYKFQAKGDGTQATLLQNYVLLAYEL